MDDEEQVWHLAENGYGPAIAAGVLDEAAVSSWLKERIGSEGF